MVWINNGTEALDNASNYKTILATCIALPVVTTVVVALRAYCRGRLLKTLYYDDYVIFFSAVCIAATTGITWNFQLTTEYRFVVLFMQDYV